jgi:hypothetical protein
VEIDPEDQVLRHRLTIDGSTWEWDRETGWRDARAEVGSGLSPDAMEFLRASFGDYSGRVRTLRHLAALLSTSPARELARAVSGNMPVIRQRATGYSGRRLSIALALVGVAAGLAIGFAMCGGAG